MIQLLLRLQQPEFYDNLYDWFEQFKKKKMVMYSIEFIKWYSGMSEEKIIAAYKRWMKETNRVVIITKNDNEETKKLKQLLIDTPF